MALKIGNIDKYIVVKETDIAYTLHSLDENEPTDIFLHFNQTKHRLNIDQHVNAFLYYDQKKRLCATTEVPYITTIAAAKATADGIKSMSLPGCGVVKSLQELHAEITDKE